MGMLSDIADTIESRLNPRTIASELVDGVVKMASQGAAEMGQALFTGNAYMPYGATEAQIPMAENAPAMDSAPMQATAQEVQSPTKEEIQAIEATNSNSQIESPQSYQEMLDSYAPPSTPVMQKEVEMER